jgi:hypothetical protein
MTFGARGHRAFLLVTSEGRGRHGAKQQGSSRPQ